VVDGHAQLARSHQCHVTTRIVWYGTLKWNEKSIPMIYIQAIIEAIQLREGEFQ
jgi:hypothetical protein